MFLKKHLIMLIALILFSNYCGATNQESVAVVKMPPKQSNSDASHDYLVKVLKLALSETQKEFGAARVEFMPVMLRQAFILQLLDIKDVLDIAASAPTRKREINFDSIKVPLYKGLLGYRMFLISPKKKVLFQHITTREQLKKLKACEGSEWPDAVILNENGYKVVKVKNYADMFEYLHTGKCDYFPRGIIEGYGEIAQYNIEHPNHKLAAFDNILLHYQLPLVFYTSHQNFVLAARVALGLKRANKDGKLLALLKTNKVTAVAFPLSKWKHTKIFNLQNSQLVKSIPTYDKSLWLTLPAENK